MKRKSKQLLELLKNEKHVFIQTHDFPDPDAVASAFGLQYILKQLNIKSKIVFEGLLQTNPIERMIGELGIKLTHSKKINMKASDKVIIVDGCKGNNNVTDQRGDVIAVIDHHQVLQPDNVPFIDIRSDYGACSTMITLYAHEYGIKLPAKVATALGLGIHIDTHSFTRHVHNNDLKAYQILFKSMDHMRVSSILRNNIFENDLKFYSDAQDAAIIKSGFCFCFLKKGCSQNLLGIMADFFLSVDEINFVVLCAKRDDKIIFSARSENPRWNAAIILRKALINIGKGGGHKDMAGAIAFDAAAFNPNEMYKKCVSLLN